MNDRKACIKVRLSKEENEKLKRCAVACGLSQSEFIRQLCKGKTPKPQPSTEFWELLHRGQEKTACTETPGAGQGKKRIGEIDSLVQKIYEDNAAGKLSDECYATLSMSYEEEQQKLKADIPEMQSYLETETDKTESLQKFIDKVKQITELRELTPELIHEFIDRIIVYAPRYLDGKRVQLMDIYYNGTGILRELSPEEMENAFQEHLVERERSKAKTA